MNKLQFKHFLGCLLVVVYCGTYGRIVSCFLLDVQLVVYMLDV